MSVPGSGVSGPSVSRRCLSASAISVASRSCSRNSSGVRWAGVVPILRRLSKSASAEVSRSCARTSSRVGRNCAATIAVRASLLPAGAMRSGRGFSMEGSAVSYNHGSMATRSLTGPAPPALPGSTCTTFHPPVAGFGTARVTVPVKVSIEFMPSSAGVPSCASCCWIVWAPHLSPTDSPADSKPGYGWVCTTSHLVTSRNLSSVR